MNICICVTNFKTDLVEAISRNTVALAEGIAAEKSTRVHLLVPGDGPHGVQETANFTWSTFAPERSYSSKTRVLKNIIALGKYLKREGNTYDLIHFQVGTPLELFLMIIFLPRVAPIRIATVWQPYLGVKESFSLMSLFGRKIGLIRHQYLFNSWLLIPFYALGQLFFTDIVFPTFFQKRQAFFAPSAKKRVIANGVVDCLKACNLGATEPNIHTADSNPDVLRVLYVGHATSVKGVDVFLHAFRTASQEEPILRATLALSSFGEHDIIHKIINELDLTDLVTIKGQVDVAHEMAKHHIFALPLKASVGTSCYPNTLLEAFSAGIPVVASDIVVVREAYEGEKAIPLVAPGDASQMADAILLMARNPKKRQEISDLQRDLYKKLFTLEQFIDNHTHLYSQLLNNYPLAQTEIRPMPEKNSRVQTVRDYYRAEDNAQQYDTVRFGNAGGQLVDAEEQRIVLDLLGNHPREKPILEVAAGTGRFSITLARLGYKVVAVDGSLAMLNLIKTVAEREGLDITCVHADAFDLPFDDSAFESVFSIRFIWHFRNYPDIVKELARVANTRVVFDMINSASLAAVTAPVANHIIYRSLHTEIASHATMLKLFQTLGLNMTMKRNAFLFPYIFYRRLPLFAHLLSWLDKLALRVGPVGSVLYYALEKIPAPE